MVPSRYMRPWHAKDLTLADDAPASTRGHFLAPLLAMEGRFDEARSQLEGARAYLVERGMSFRLGAITLSVACVEFLAEDYEAAQRELGRGLPSSRKWAKRESSRRWRQCRRRRSISSVAGKT